MLELLNDKEKKKEDKSITENPYGAAATGGECETVKKEFSDGDEDGFVRLEIDKKIIKKNHVTKVKVKILNLDYESSLYSKEVRLDSARKKSPKSTAGRMSHRNFKNMNIDNLKSKTKTLVEHHNITIEDDNENKGREDVSADSVKDIFDENKDESEKAQNYLEVQKHPDVKMYLVKIDPGFVDELDKFISEKEKHNESKPEERHTASHYLFNKDVNKDN